MTKTPNTQTSRFGTKQDWARSGRQVRSEWMGTIRDLAFEASSDLYGKPKRARRRHKRRR